MVKSGKASTDFEEKLKRKKSKFPDDDAVKMINQLAHEEINLAIGL